MRIWLIAINLFLGGVLVTALGALILMREPGTSAVEAAEVAAAPIKATEPPLTVQSPEDKANQIAETVAYDTLIEMKANMRDPGSAQFRSLYVVNYGTVENPMPIVCGEVNAHNSFGGYSGFIPFYAAGSFVKTAQMEGFAGLYEENCLKRPQMMTITF